MAFMKNAKTAALDQWTSIDWDDELRDLCIKSNQRNFELAAFLDTEESQQDDSWIFMNKPGNSTGHQYTSHNDIDRVDAQDLRKLEGIPPNATPDAAYQSIIFTSSHKYERSCGKSLESTVSSVTLYTAFCNTLDSVRQAYNDAVTTEVPLGSEEEAKELEESSKTPARIIDMVNSVGMFLWDCWNERPLILNA
ncbi:hypothetical protein BC567DRAFT_211548 [Phyllosticta citribraziliensis]